MRCPAAFAPAFLLSGCGGPTDETRPPRALPASVDFNLPYGEWIRLFRANGLQVEDLIEPRPPARVKTTYHDYAAHEWARRWPGENIWKVRKR